MAVASRALWSCLAALAVVLSEPASAGVLAFSKAECMLQRWNSGSWLGGGWEPASTPPCALGRRSDLDFLQGQTVAVLGDGIGVQYTKALADRIGGCKPVKRGTRCREAETFLSLKNLHYYQNEGCTSCQECYSRLLGCSNNITLLYVPVEQPWDFRISSTEYETTQRAVVMSVLQKHEPSYIFFNAGLCCTANYPRNQPYRAVSRIIEGQTSKKWDEYVKSKALMAWSSGESAAFYQAGLRQYVQLLTDQLPSAKLLWVRTSAPREEKWRPEWRLPDANLTLAASRDRVMKLNDIADLVMADAGIPAVDAWAMSRHPTGLLHTDNVYLDGMNGKFYSVVVDACVSYMKGIWMAGNRRAEL